jgi:hypothetical protein
MADQKLFSSNHKNATQNLLQYNESERRSKGKSVPPQLNRIYQETSTKLFNPQGFASTSIEGTNNLLANQSQYNRSQPPKRIPKN